MKIAAALGGGGLRGIAHIPFLDQLDNANIKLSGLSGSSFGSIVGAMYASGVSSRDMISFFKSTPIFDITKFSIVKPGLLDAEKFEKKLSTILPERFESLEIPLSIAVCNLQTASVSYLNSGSLIRAILASCAVPFVFSPVEIDGSLYTDGGVLDNLPVAPLLGKFDKIIGSYVNSPLAREKSELKTTFQVMIQANQMMLHAHSKNSFEHTDILLDFPVGKFKIFSTKQIDAIKETAENYLQGHERFNQFLIEGI